VAVQTVNSRLGDPEKPPRHQRLNPSGRGLILTDSGKAACMRAQKIFHLGRSPPDKVRAAAGDKGAKLACWHGGFATVCAPGHRRTVASTPGLGKAEMKLDPSAKVYVEPYVKSSSMRFDFGTTHPESCLLTNIDAGAASASTSKPTSSSNRLAALEPWSVVLREIVLLGSRCD
jgi:hypothetical protein